MPFYESAYHVYNMMNRGSDESSPVPAITTPARRPGPRRKKRTVRRADHAPAGVLDSLPASFDVAITFAGPDRPIAERAARALRRRGLTVFYDRFYEEELWGVHLPDLFGEIFTERSRFCLMFVSKAYATREWPDHERQMAIARSIRQRGSGYILPVQLDKTVLKGMPPTIGYLSRKEYDISDIVRMVVKKVRA
jgi:hypothetical protein